jgi:hypothetical protein
MKKVFINIPPKLECSNLTAFRSNVTQQYREIIAVKAEVRAKQASSSNGKYKMSGTLALITELLMVVTQFRRKYCNIGL